jgi:hypothetical protein
MADHRRFPLLYQINARTHVTGLGPTATLDDVADATLDRLEASGVDWLYLLGVWQTGAAGRAVSLATPAIRQDCVAALPDLTDDDICGSCFAVTGYRVHEQLGGDKALARLRDRLAGRGIRLMVDFVPNHTAPDHPWATGHPDRYIEGTEADLAAAPGNWTRVPGPGGDRILACGRDPYFPGWPDTLQLDYSSPAVREAMRRELRAAAAHADGLRCDMAMLVLPDVFERTWGRSMAPFWPDAIDEARIGHPDLVLMAEVYWDREFDLQRQGFDYTYDKRLYDRLGGGGAGAVRAHLRAEPGFQARSARFLENHDEPRAATTFGPGDRHRAAATATFLVPGMRFFHDGQFEGRRVHVPVHLARAPVEPVDGGLAAFYAELLAVLRDPVVHDGDWRLLDVGAAWAGNDSHADLLAFSWSAPGGDLRYVVAVNLADHWSQGYAALPPGVPAGPAVTLADRLGPARYERDGDELRGHGIYLDLAPWGHHVLAVG